MEAKLAEYRSKKSKENPYSKFFNGLSNFNVFRRSQTIKVNTASETSQESESESLQQTTVTQNTSTTSDLKSGKVLWIQRGLQILLWLLLWLFFIELQFGAVYFVTSILILVYFNTGTDPKRDKELSAYSVFNPNFERLDGTFTAEQFEKELKYGAASVH